MTQILNVSYIHKGLEDTSRQAYFKAYDNKL